MHRALPLALSFACLALLTAPVASAQPRCSDLTVSATGAPGILHVTGRHNATSAWSAKVRSELGASYASWGRARGRHLHCSRVELRYVCSAAARPCRPITAVKACEGSGCK
jgi:hypothetical protein